MRVEDVPYEVDGIAMVGHLAIDDATAAARPTVLVCHEGNGMSTHVRETTEALAQLGYAAFALDYIGGGRQANDEATWAQLSRMMEDPTVARGRAEAGLRILLDQPGADPSRVAVLGYCFGAVMGLEMARGGFDVRAVVGFHPGLLQSRPDDSRTITASILMCIGTEDPYMTRDQRHALEQELLDAEVEDWRIEVYGGIGHGFTNPDSGALGLPGVEYHQPSAERSWRSALALLAETVGP
ncbi:MAG: dienelactone hydrolase family protein [Acidimicrobiia bacterium]|nr:dienelactone hydrolase family protein [Acidimicrobiia bacterium]